MLNYVAFFLDVFLYWNDGSRVGHIILDIVLFYDLSDFIATIIIYVVLNNKYFMKLVTNSDNTDKIHPDKSEEEESA